MTTNQPLWRFAALACAVLTVLARVPAEAAAPADLMSLSLEQLLDVSIVGASKYEQKQGDVAAAVSVITRQEIQAFGWHTLAEALASLPGVYTSYDRQYSYIGVRGFGLPGDLNTRVLVTINGNRVNDPNFDQGPTGPEFPVDMDMVERIEYIPGPGGAVYGQNAMLGVINVVTRSGADLGGGKVAATYQDPQALTEARVSWGKAPDDGFDVVVSASDLYARGEDRYFDFGASGISGVAVGLDGERNRQFFARVARGAWSLEQIVADHLKYDPTGAFLSDPLVPGQYQGDRHALTQLRYDDSIASDTVQLSGRLFEGEEDYRSLLYFSGAPIASPADSTWRGGELRVLFLGLSGHKLMWGLEGQDNLRENQASDDFSNPSKNYFLGLHGYRVGIYVQDEWRISGPLTATLGLREDDNDMTGTKASPRAALIWSLAATTVKALYGTAYRAPNVYQRDYGDGQTQSANYALKGESIETAELVADQRIGRDLTLPSVAVSVDPEGHHHARHRSLDRAVAVSNGSDRQGSRLGMVGGQNLGFRSPAARQPVLAGCRLQGGGELLIRRGAWANSISPRRCRGSARRCRGRRCARATRCATTASGSPSTACSSAATWWSNLIVTADTRVSGLKLSVGLYNLFDKRYAQPAAVTNWQNAFEQDGRSVQLKLTYGF